MPHLVSLSEMHRDDLGELITAAARYASGGGPRADGAVALFFPSSSLRTRFSFERGAVQMGLQPISFPPETLDKEEDLVDVAGYLAQWADLAVVRHPDLAVLERLAAADALPIVNAMTDDNHPCEVLSDLYALSLEADLFELRYLFVGADGNIARAWGEAAHAFGLDLRQSCPEPLRTSDVAWDGDLRRAIATADVVITDAPGGNADALVPYRVTAELLDSAPPGVRFAPCPPFVRGREVSADAIAHSAFVGYGFKRHLAPMQQAAMAWAAGW